MKRMMEVIFLALVIIFAGFSLSSAAIEECQLYEAAAIIPENDACQRIHNLIDAGYDVNTRCGDNSALERACFSLRAKVVQVLLENGADPNAQNARGQTSLEMALMVGCYDIKKSRPIIKMLLDAGADMNISNKEGRTPLQKALQANCSREIVTIFKNYSKQNKMLAKVSSKNEIRENERIEAHQLDGEKIDKKSTEATLQDSVLRKQKPPIKTDIPETTKTHKNEGLDAFTQNLFDRWVSSDITKQIQNIIRMGNDINGKDSNGDTILIKSCIEKNQNSLEIVSFLLSRGADVNVRDNKGWAPLFHASAQYQLDLVKLLLSKGADVNVRDNNGASALKTVCWFPQLDDKKMEIVRLLIHAGADIDAKDNFGGTALMSAYTNKDYELVRLLIESGANINTKDSNGEVILIKLCTGRDDKSRDIVKFIISQGVDVNARNKEGLTALICASTNADIELIKLLLEKNADVNSTDENGNSPLINACVGGTENAFDIIKLLLDRGADANVQNKEGRTPLMSASRSGNIDIVKLLLLMGADTSIIDKSKKTALIHASETRSYDIVQLLEARNRDHKRTSLQQKTAVSFVPKDMDGNVGVTEPEKNTNAAAPKVKKVSNPALIEFTGKGLLENVTHLLDSGVDVNSEDSYGVTALIEAAWTSQSEVLQLLLDSGANINAMSASGATALMCASWKGNPEMVKILLNSGARADIRDINGNTALTLASVRGNEAVLDILKEVTNSIDESTRK